MLYLERITPEFREYCVKKGLIKRYSTGRRATMKEGFVVEVSDETLVDSIRATRSFQDCMVCLSIWMPHENKKKFVEQLQARFHLTPEEEIELGGEAPPDAFLDMSLEARILQRQL